MFYENKIGFCFSVFQSLCSHLGSPDRSAGNVDGEQERLLFIYFLLIDLQFVYLSFGVHNIKLNTFIERTILVHTHFDWQIKATLIYNLFTFLSNFND